MIWAPPKANTPEGSSTVTSWPRARSASRVVGSRLLSTATETVAHALEAAASTVGDRLVCLKNDRVKGLMNGGLWNVERVHKTKSSTKLELRISSLDQEGAAWLDVEVPMQFFNGTEKEMDWRDLKRSDQFTYGWALTCHKSQGSQWDDLLVFDEGRVFREDAAKWTYTAITRAAERVVVIQ